MEPEWHQDSKSIQPRQLPQFEIAGPQIDNEYRQQAARMIVSRAGIVLTVVLAVVIISVMPAAIKGQRSTFGQLNVNTEDPFTGMIRLRLEKISRQDKIKGLIFDIKAGRTRSGDSGVGFLGESNTNPNTGRRVELEFVILDLTLINNSTEDFRVNPNSFIINGRYRTAVETRHYSGAMRPGDLDPSKSRSGSIVFKMPKNTPLSSLEILGAGGPIARIAL
ncbi:MAG: DUF4352 domain-containing protein [Acidobacteriota bacterium]|nr:DUF4352 domain-containing protein [Acidobacteriota bacterium]